jgi:hypothetical protein
VARDAGTLDALLRAQSCRPKLLARVENFVPYYAGLAALFASRKVSDLLAECCGEPVVLFKDKINFKLPGGAGFAPHQDAPAYVDFGIEHPCRRAKGL